MKITITALALALPLLAAAQPQAVWRCGADGSSYSSTPCNDGRSIDVPGARPTGDVQAAFALAAHDGQSADRLQRDRSRTEAQNRGNGLAGFPLIKPKAEPASVPALARRHRQARDPAIAGTWRAIAPVSR